MRILYVIEGISQKGGIERIIVDKMNALATPSQYTYSEEHLVLPTSLKGEESLDVLLLTVWKGEDEPAFPLSDRVERYSLNVDKPKGRLAWLMTLAKVLTAYNKAMEEIQPDVVVHFRAIGAFLIGYGKHTCRTVFESHGVRYSNNHLWLYPRMERNVDTIVCLTNGDRDEYLRHGRSKDVRVIPNFSKIQSAGRPDYSSKHCIFIGRFCPEKNPARLFSLWKQINCLHPDWTLDVYGHGWPESADASVQCYGNTDNVAEVLSHGSVLLLTSRSEGFGLTILEAMKCGLPVVSLDTPCGPADLIDDGVTGYCTPYDSDEAFVDAVCRLMEDASLRVKMGRAGQERAKLFDKDVIIGKWVKLFEE